MDNPPLEDGWRRLITPDFRQKILNKIMEVFKKHLKYSEPEGLLELENMAVKFEEEVYTAADSQSSYLMRISTKLMTMESPFQPPLGDSSQPKIGTSNQNLANMVKSPQPNPSTRNGSLADLGMPEIIPEKVDWRSQLQPGIRQRSVNEILETLKRHLPFSGQEGQLELRKIAVRFEEGTFTTATSQSDYLRKISLKILSMETRGQSSPYQHRN